MKKLLQLLFLSLVYMGSVAQSVTETVNFDNYVSPSNNDLTNRFYSNSQSLLIQSQTNGITGGSLVTDDSLNWGNDNIVYCSKFEGNIGATYNTSICFKYNTSTINPNSFDRAAAIWFKPNANSNHYIITTVERNQRLGILSYAWNNNYNTLLNLVHDHWYRLSITAVFVGGVNDDQIDLLAEVFDLGISGLNNPILVDSSSGTISDTILIRDNAISVEITGSRFGGATYLDDFYYQGVKSADSCSITTAVDEFTNESDVKIFPNPVDKTQQTFTVSQNTSHEDLKLELVDLYGKTIIEKTDIDKTEIIAISNNVSAGVYIARLHNSKYLYSIKLIVQ